MISNINVSLEEEINYSQELKELKKRKFELDNRLEEKVQIFNTKYEENKNLQIINKNLRGKLKNNAKERKNFTPSIQIKKKSKDEFPNNQINCISSASNFNPYPENKEIVLLKEELAESELILKTKNKILKDLKKKIKIKIYRLEEITKDTNEMANNKNILKDELKSLEYKIKLEEEHTNNKSQTGSNKCEAPGLHNFTYNYSMEVIQKSGEIVKEKLLIEKSIKKMKEEILDKTSQILELKRKFQYILDEIEEKGEVFAQLIREKYEIRNKIEFFTQFFDNYEKFLKSIEYELSNIKSNMKHNKSNLEKIENELNYKLYFIRFSNSFVRSFFNIINTRRLQIEMVKNLNKEEREVFDFMFKKLDDLETSLIKEYKEYLVLCEE